MGKVNVYLIIKYLWKYNYLKQTKLKNIILVLTIISQKLLIIFFLIIYWLKSFRKWIEFFWNMLLKLKKPKCALFLCFSTKPTQYIQFQKKIFAIQAISYWRNYCQRIKKDDFNMLNSLSWGIIFVFLLYIIFNRQSFSRSTILYHIVLI